MKRWSAASKYLPWVVYGGLALAVLGPLLRPGFVLTLDMVFTPQLRMPTTSSNDYVFRVLLHGLNLFIASDVIEKCLLFLVLLLSGAGMHLLVKAAGCGQTAGAYIAGIIYMVNPFTYDRFMAGQYEVLLGYALLPWFTRLLLKFLAGPGWRPAVWLAASAALVSIVSIHTIGLLVILSAAALCVLLWRRRGDRVWRRNVLKYGGLAAAGFVAASSYWLVPLAFGHGSVAAQLGSISSADQSAFATAGNGLLGKVGNVVRLQGFWVEARGMYDLPQTRVPAWGLLGVMVWGLVVAGAVSLWRSGKWLTVMIFAISAFTGGLLALGVLSGWPASHVPFLAGFREPEKFVALLALGYALLAGFGAAAVLRYCREQGGRVFAVGGTVLLAALPLVWTAPMLGGFGGQLRAVHYPADWTAMNTRLGKDRSDGQTLFLPWHLYMRYGFAGRIIASPAPAFFDTSAIVSDNPEFRGAARANATPTKRALDDLLPHAAITSDLATRLAKLHIRYVLLAREDDYRQYSYLRQASGLQLVAKSQTLELYRNNAYEEE
ncbi:MAG TPA: hypothetical protein VLF40_05030 [Candidatus Saccharimonadales bacterium]|nr:hypothetical protein [Candidatus Saccharimonadales bacterium]